MHCLSQPTIHNLHSLLLPPTPTFFIFTLLVDVLRPLPVRLSPFLSLPSSLALLALSRPLSPFFSSFFRKEPKVALIVPIRDAANALSQGVGRWKNADELVEHMCTFLPKANAPLFDVIFIEQSNDGNPFNKGVLFNAGYKLTVTKGYSHMVLHDVDQIPENTKNSYGHPGETAVHLLTATSQWDYTPMHKDTVGGALSLSHAVYAAVGGYSNLFWGWGGEDNNMYTRLNSGPGVRRPKLRVGRYKALFHPRVMGLDETEQFKKNHKIIHTLSHEAASDGIATVKYKELQARHRPACSSGGGGSSGGGNSVVIHTIEVLNTENLHPDAAGSPAADSPPPPPPAAAPPPPAGSKFRLDGRCGPSYPAPGAPSFGECDPYSDADQKGPCCNPTSGWCGNERGASWGHCPPRCTDCVDFSSSKPNDQPLSDPPSPPQDNGAASAANGDEAIYEIADGYDCEGNDLKQHVCETDVSRDECIAAMHVLCLDTPKCVGFNFPGGWLKEACPTLMRFPDSTIYIHQDILAKRRAEMPSEEDRAADVFQKLSALHGAPPVEMSVACPLRVVPSKITVSTGGESIAAVYQRAEEDEYPKHRKGAFVAGCTVTDSSNRARKPVDAFSNVLNGMQVVGPGNVVPGGGECTSVLGNDMPGVLMQRYEYANLYHTMCDWASLYETMHTHGLERDKFQIVWLDGHAAGALDLPWGLIFTKHITFVKHLTNEPCYNPAYFTADGSKSDLYNGCQRGAAKGAGFATFALEQLGLLNASVKRTIVVIDRKPYVSHPRLQTPLPAVTSRSWENVNEIMLKLKAAFPLDEVKLVDLASHTFVEQVEIIRSAWGVVGMHGAAMAFMLFMSPNSVLVEVSVKSPKMFNNFAFCAPWVHHTRIELGSGSSRDHAKSKAYYVQPATIITALQRWGPPS